MDQIYTEKQMIFLNSRIRKLEEISTDLIFKLIENNENGQRIVSYTINKLPDFPEIGESKEDGERVSIMNFKCNLHDLLHKLGYTPKPSKE